MKMRTYLILDDRMQHIGQNTSKRFPEYAGRIIPRLDVTYEDKDIIRLTLNNYTIDSTGKPGIGISQQQKAAQAMESILAPILGRQENPPIYLRDHKRNTLNDKQKEMLLKQLRKDFGSAWDELSDVEKASFWKTGDTFIATK